MFRLLFDLLIDTDDPPERLGIMGFAIMAGFGLFATVIWFYHPHPV